MGTCADPAPEVTYRCRACGGRYSNRDGAIECFYGHTRRIADMVVTIVNHDDA